MMEWWNNGILGKNKNKSIFPSLTQHSNIPIVFEDEKDGFTNYC